MANEVIDLIREELVKKSIPLDELISFRNEIEKEIKMMQNQFQENMIKELRETVLANGIELELFVQRLVGDGKNKKPPKYKNPSDEKQTWSGHGKKPNWVKELLEAGKNLDDFLIKD